MKWCFCLSFLSCTAQQEQWVGFWGFILLLLVFAVGDLWHSRKK